MRHSNAGELTIRQDGERVTIRKSSSADRTSISVEQEDEYSYHTEYSDVLDEEPDIDTADAMRSVMITAPLVGVFGHVKPLVGLNARVSEGQIVGVIEAMNLTTEISAPATGTIVDIFIEASHPVEYGQALFEIRPD